MHADGELSPAHEQELMSFLYEHPELQHELTAFSMAKLIPDDNLVYTRKVSLLKPEGGAKVIPFAPWKRYAIAAGVAAILLAGGYGLLNTTGNDRPAVATITPAAESAPTAKTGIASAEKTKPEAPIAAEPEGDNKPAVGAAVEAETRPARSMAMTDKRQTPGRKAAVPKDIDAHIAEAVAINETPLQKVKPASMVAYKSGPEISAATVTNLPPAAIYVYEGENETKTSIVDKLPIDELKKEGMENVVTAMANGYDRINAIKQGISETVVSFKVEKRKLIVSF